MLDGTPLKAVNVVFLTHTTSLTECSPESPWPCGGRTTLPWRGCCGKSGRLSGDMPGAKRHMHNLAPAHAFRFTMDGGVWMQWKQWSTEESWCKAVQLLSAQEVVTLGQWRPAECAMDVGSDGLGRLEAWCASTPAGSEYLGLHREFKWLRNVVDHQVPGAYAPGTQVNRIAYDLRGLPHARPGADAPGTQHREYIIAQQYPGADVPSLPHDALVRIEGVTHTGKGMAIRSDKIGVGSFIAVAAPDGTKAHGFVLPFIVGQVVDALCKRGTLVLAWFVPELARVDNFRRGQFGPWVPLSDIATEDVRQYCVPDPLLNVSSRSILQANFELTDEQTLPYDVLDAVRTQHGIDLTGLNMSMTRRGNVYRSYVLMRGV